MRAILLVGYSEGSLTRRERRKCVASGRNSGELMKVGWGLRVALAGLCVTAVVGLALATPSAAAGPHKKTARTHKKAAKPQNKLPCRWVLAVCRRRPGCATSQPTCGIAS